MPDILPRELPPASTVSPNASLISDNGVIVEKATPLQITAADTRLLRVPEGETALPVDSLASAEGQVLAVINGRIKPIDNDPAGAEQAAEEAKEARDEAEAARDQAEVFRNEAGGFADQTALDRAATEAARDEAEQSAGIAQGATLTKQFYPGARSFVPQGAVVDSFTAGSGYTDGTYDITATGGDFQEQPVVRVTVSGGAITSAIISLAASGEPDAGLYIGSSPTVPTVPLDSLGAGTGGSVVLAAASLVPVGRFYYTDHASDADQVSRFQNQSNAAVEVDVSVDYLNIALARGYAEQAEDAVAITRPFNVPIADLHPALAKHIKRLSITGKPADKFLRFGLFRRILSGGQQIFQADLYLADDATGSGTNATLAAYKYIATNANTMTGDVEIDFSPSGSSGMQVTATVVFNEDGSEWTDNLAGGTFANARVSPSAEDDNAAMAAYIATDIQDRFNSDGRLLPGGRYVPFQDGHSEVGSSSATLGYPNFLSKFIKRASLVGFIQPYVQRIILTPTLRQVLIKDAARNTTGARWNDATGAATPSVVTIGEYDLASNVGLRGTLELDWSTVPPAWLGSPGVTLTYTPAQGGFYQSVYFAYANFEDYLQRHDHQVVINVGPDKASFTGAISGSTLTVTSSTGRITPGLVLKGASVAASTMIVAYSGGSSGGNGTYLLNGTHATVSAEAMTAGREYTTIADAMADPRCDLGAPDNKILILLDAQGGTLSNPIEYPVQGLALKAYCTLASTGFGACLVPTDPLSATALVEMLLTSKVMNLQARPLVGYAFHTRPGSSGGPGGYGVQDRKMQGIYNVLIHSGPDHNTRHIAGDMSAGMHLVTRGVRHKTDNPSRVTSTNEYMYMHDVTQNASFPNLAPSVGMRWTVEDCSSEGPSPLVKWQALDNGNPFDVQSTIELYGNTPGDVILVPDSNGDHSACVIGIHGGSITWTGNAPDIEVSAP